MLQKIYKLVLAHKIITAIIIVVAIAGGYYWYGSAHGGGGQVTYVLAAAEKGTIVSSVSGSGRVAVSNQVDLNFKASGDVTSITAKEGQDVKTGTILARIDASDAQKAVGDAEDSLQSAKISLEKLQKPATDLEITQAENALIAAQKSKQTANDNLLKSYEDGFNTVANAFIDFPKIISGLDQVLYGFDFNSNQNNLNYYADSVKQYNEGVYVYRDSADAAYKKARTSYNENFDNYKIVDRHSDPAAIEAIINETYETAKSLSDSAKAASNLIQYYEDRFTERNLTPNAVADSALTGLNSYIGQINSNLASLLSAKQSIQNYKDSITSAERTIDEKIQSLANVKAPADPLDIASQEINIKQRENALAEAQQSYGDYVIRAPFDGVIAAVNVEKGDTVSSVTAAITLITKQQIAEISLNEVDAAKVKVGQKATLAFDAVDGLSIVGQVAQVDSLGTVSQGVVTYDVKINFDTQSEQVKPGMTVSASIIIDSRQGILVVPNSAIKTNSNGSSYVEVPNEDFSNNSGATVSGVVLTSLPSQKAVEVGITDDTSTEIISGLNEGDMVVIRTVNSSSSSASSGASGASLFQFGGEQNRGSSSSSSSRSGGSGGVPPM